MSSSTTAVVIMGMAMFVNYFSWLGQLVACTSQPLCALTPCFMPVCLFRVYAYASGDGEGAAGGSEDSMPAQNDFKARLAMFKQKETGSTQGGGA